MKQLLLMTVLLAGLLEAPTALARETTLHEERSLYSRIVVKKIDDLICLQFNVRSEQRNQSCMDSRNPDHMVFSYVRMSMTALLFQPEPRNILVVGLGGGTLPTAFRQLFPEAVIDIVEIDPAVVKVAEDYFDFTADEQMQVYSQDARVWTKRAQNRARRYDLIILDAFNGEYIPEHLMTKEYLQETRELLAPAGTLIANTFALSELYHHESATYASVFGDFIDFKIPQSGNRVVIVPGVEVSDEQLQRRAADLKSRLRPYRVEIGSFARLIIKQRRSPPRWQSDARVLTDQYSPANLLRAR